MIKPLSIIIIFILLITNSKAQNTATMVGKIIDDATNQPLIGATISIANSTIGAATDKDGNFSIALTKGTYILQINSMGYETAKQQIDITNTDNVVLCFKLKNKQNELNTITISGSRFEKKLSEETVSMEVVKPLQIQNAGLTQVDDMLKRIPGVDVVDGQANIRAGSGWSYGAGSRVLVMVDDLPMLTSDAGDVKWDFLPIENCEQIEVIKGASSALYGSSALNGVINFRTAFPRNTPQTKITIQQGIYDTPHNKYEKWWGNNFQKFNGVSFFHSRKIKQLDVVVGGNYYSDDSYLQGGYSTRGRINTNLRYRFKKITGLQVGLNINAQTSKGSTFFLWAADDKFKIVGNRIYTDSTLYLKPRGGLDTPQTTLSYYNSYRINIDPYITYQTRNDYKLSLRNRFFNSVNINNTKQGSSAQLYYSEFQIQKKYKHDYNVSAGMVYNYTNVNSDLFKNHTAENAAAYTQIDKKLFNKLWLSFGGRYEYYRVDTVKATTKPLGRIGLNYQVAKATFIRASYGMGYRFPTIAEKYVSTSISTISIIPNPTLLPETGWNAELGVKQLFKIGNTSGMIDAAAFYTRFNNMVEFVFGLQSSNFQFHNVANAQVKGIDFSILTQSKINKITLHINTGFTYCLPQDIGFNTMTAFAKTISYSDTTKNILKYRYTTSAKTDIELGYKTLHLGSFIRYNTYMVNIDQPFNFLFPSIAQYTKKWGHKDTWIIDVRLKYDIAKNASLAFIVKNVLNFEYTERPAYIAPPRSFTVQFVYQL
jgi:iron complex outermembrane receptor protein